MNPTVLGAFIGAAGAILVCLINNWFTDRKRKKDDRDKEITRAAQEAAKEERLAARVNTIERTQEEICHKLDVHNGYAEKIGSVQRDVTYIKGRLEKGD